MGYAGQLQLAGTTYGEFCSDPLNSDCVNSHRRKSKEIFSLYCCAYLATKTLEGALVKEIGPLPRGPPAARFDDAMPRDITNFQMVPYAPRRSRRDRLQPVVEGEEPKIETVAGGERQRNVVPQLPWWLQWFGVDLASLPLPYKWLLAVLCFFLPNLMVHIACSFVKRLLKASATEAGNVVIETRSALLDGVNKLSDQVDNSFEQQVKASLPEKSRGWLLPFLIVVAGAFMKKL